MSNSIDINRYFSKDEGWTAEVRVRINNLYVYFSQATSKKYKTETAAIKRLISRLESLFPIIPDLKKRVEEKYKELIEEEWNGEKYAEREDMEEALTFTKKQADQMTHVSCRFQLGKIRDYPVTRTSTELWGLPQYDLKDRIQNLDKESRAFKLFNENTCSVCLDTFKEVLDDKRHLVVTNCCHVLCCTCLDNILKKKKRNETALCPLCKVELEPDIFDLLALYIDLTINKNLPGVVFVDHGSDTESDS